MNPRVNSLLYGAGSPSAPAASSAPTAQDSLRSGLESSLSDMSDVANQSLSDFIANDSYLSDLRASADELMGGINDQIATLTSQMGEDTVDVDALTGMLNESFDKTGGKIMDATMLSAQKSAMEMDAYLGSSRSDARSAVRSQMAGGIAQQLVTSASQNIAALYANSTKSVVDTILAGKQINAQAKNAFASSIASLTNASANVLLGTTSAITNSYTASISVATDLIKAKTSLLGTIYQNETANRGLDIQKGALDLKKDQFSFEKWKQSPPNMRTYYPNNMESYRRAMKKWEDSRP